MTDTTNAAPAANENLLQKIEAYCEQRLAALEQDAIDVVEASAAKLADLWAIEKPYVKAFILLLFQQETKVAVGAAITSTATANPADILVAVGTAVAASAGANAVADIKTEIEAQQAADAANAADAASEANAAAGAAPQAQTSTADSVADAQSAGANGST